MCELEVHVCLVNWGEVVYTAVLARLPVTLSVLVETIILQVVAFSNDIIVHQAVW